MSELVEPFQIDIPQSACTGSRARGCPRPWVEHDRSRHFPAMEAPEQPAEDLSAFFDGLR
ncbi:hypothetical protein [Nonomuraea sp. NPDC005650]|uniref:hypothetical protein n=1 Tax=Nonomuraea sp. NPDC005650 TaxID=3157045 RepID=UPI0033B47C13